MNIFFNMTNCIDQLDRVLNFSSSPKRIISLVPSITELVWDLGMEKELVGRTKFCIHPKGAVEDIAVVGGTKNLHFDRIASLNPDLIIVNKEENDKEQVEKLIENHPVFVSDVPTFGHSLDLITRLGELFNKKEIAMGLVQKLYGTMRNLKVETTQKAAYLIWQKPYMTIGNDTYIHDMLRRLGYENIFKHKTRYPETTIDEIKALQPGVILLSSEPFPFKSKHIAEFQKHFPNTTIKVVNGELFSWYGTRLLKLKINQHDYTA